MVTGTKTQSTQRASRRAQRRVAAQRRDQRRRQLRVFAGATVLVLLVVGVVVATNRSPSDNFPAISAATGVHDAIPQDGRMIGDPNAPVTVVEWGDYQCPACRHFAREIEPTLIRDYVATGKVRFEYRDYAFIGDESSRAAEAAFCAIDQDAYWPYHETLFLNQREQNAGGYSSGRLKEMATVLDLETEQFDRCLSDRTYKDDVDAMQEEARNLGVTGTPSFVVNGQLIDYRGYDSLVAAIESELAKAQ